MRRQFARLYLLCLTMSLLWLGLSFQSAQANVSHAVKPCTVAGGVSNCQSTEMSFWELYDVYVIRKALEMPTAQVETDLHLKVSLPLATFFTALLVAPLALMLGRLGPTVGASLSLALVFIWYFLFSLFKPLGAQAVVAPFLAAWVQNLLFLGVGAAVWLWLARDRWFYPLVDLFSGSVQPHDAALERLS